MLFFFLSFTSTKGGTGFVIVPVVVVVPVVVIVVAAYCELKTCQGLGDPMINIIYFFWKASTQFGELFLWRKGHWDRFEGNCLQFVLKCNSFVLVGGGCK